VSSDHLETVIEIEAKWQELTPRNNARDRQLDRKSSISASANMVEDWHAA
jgi:hypothetical protein